MLVHVEVSKKTSAKLKVRKFYPIDNDVLSNRRTGSATKQDIYHSFSDIVDNYAGNATVFNITGGDGIHRKLYQLEGACNGQAGIFEWIVDPRKEHGVTHRRFISKGTITGTPNQIPK